MTTLEAIRNDVLAECKEDHVGIWSVLWEVRERVGTDDPVVLRRLALDIIHKLLESGGIEIGMCTRDGKRFRPWLLSPSLAVKQIGKQWNELGREPNIGDFAYLTCSSTVSSSSVS